MSPRGGDPPEHHTQAGRPDAQPPATHHASVKIAAGVCNQFRSKQAKTGGRLWFAGCLVCAAVIVSPLAVVIASLLHDSGGAWQHLFETRLSSYALNTAMLVTGVCALSLALGVVPAWFVARFDFPGRSVLGWALVLPLAVPSYVAAYAVTDLLQFSGPVQTSLRSLTGWAAGEYWFPSARSLVGAIVILASTLYPYVYIASRIAFGGQCAAMSEAGRTLGLSATGALRRIALPLARPAIAAATMLVAMETIADFGAVECCAVDTLTTGVYRAWFGLDSQVAAAQLSTLIVAIAVCLVAVEAVLRRRQRHYNTTSRCARDYRSTIAGWRGVTVSALCVLPLSLGFVIPVSRLVYLTQEMPDPEGLGLVVRYGQNSLLLALASGLIAAGIALVVVCAHRIRRQRASYIAKLVCRFGYALPGPVIAIGVLTLAASIDRWTHSAWRSVDGPSPTLLLGGTVAVLLFAYQCRFSGIAIGLLDGSMRSIGRGLDDSARSLGLSATGVVRRIHAPLVRRALLAGVLLVFVDVVKELPATLMLRPFNFDTLAVRVYQLASEERLGEAATAALAIIAAGILPMVLVSREIDRGR